MGLGATVGLGATGATVAGNGRSVARAVGLDVGSAAFAPQAEAIRATAVNSARLVGLKVASDALEQPTGDNVEGVGPQYEAFDHIRAGEELYLNECADVGAPVQRHGIVAQR